MIIVKIVTASNRSPTGQEVDRLIFGDNISNVKLDTIEERSQKILNAEKSELLLTWYDGEDYCTVREEADILDALETSKSIDNTGLCVKLYAQKKSQAPESVDVKTTSELKHTEWSEEEKKAFTNEWLEDCYKSEMETGVSHIESPIMQTKWNTPDIPVQNFSSNEEYSSRPPSYTWSAEQQLGFDRQLVGTGIHRFNSYPEKREFKPYFRQTSAGNYETDTLMMLLFEMGYRNDVDFLKKLIEMSNGNVNQIIDVLHQLRKPEYFV